MFCCFFFLSFSLFFNYYLYDLRHITNRRIFNWIQTNNNVDTNVVVVVVAFYSCVHACNECNFERRRKSQKEITISNLSICLHGKEKRTNKISLPKFYFYRSMPFIVFPLFCVQQKKLHWNWWYYVYFEPCLINGTACNLNVDGKKDSSKRARERKI